MFHNELDKMTVIYIIDLKYILLTLEQQREFIKDYKMSMEMEKKRIEDDPSVMACSEIEEVDISRYG